MSARKLLTYYGLWMAALSAVNFAAPSWHIVVWTAIGISGSAAVAVGIVRNAPRRKAPWVLLSMGLLAFISGDFSYDLLTRVLGQEDPFPSVADALYLVMFPLTAAGMLGLARSGASSRDRASLVDSLTLTASIGLLSWIFLINPYVENPELSGLAKAISIGYPLQDVLLVATVATLLITVRRSPAVVLLGVAALSLFLADVAYGLIRLHGSWQVGGPVDVGWIVFYAGAGAAALHPSMLSLTEPKVLPRGEVSTRRLMLLALSSLIAPAVLMFEVVRGDVHDGAVIALLSALMFGLVLYRLSGVVNIHRRAVAVERGLRAAGAALLSATDVAQVRSTVRTAVAQLLPPDTPHGSVLAAQDAGIVPSRLVQMAYTRTLDPAVAAEVGEFEVTLVCALAAPDSRTGPSPAGALLVAADEKALVELQGPVAVLASQAALALARIALSAEITRRRSDEYFRTLVLNTSDVILIVDDSNRIRYASPSAEPAFGTGELIGVALPDLIEPTERGAAAQVLDLARTGQPGADTTDWVVLRTDGEHVQVEASCRDLRDDPTVGGLVLTLRDVTVRRQLERELTHRAFYDSLTGLANRALFQERVQQAAARAQRTGATVGVLHIDLDDFKVVNDAMGHDTGDQLLVAVSQRLAAALLPVSTAARLGSDEFAALIEDARGPADVEAVADRVVAALVEPFTLGEGVVNASASIGVATTADSSGAQELLRHADLALYLAKGSGKGHWRRYEAALHTALLERLELRTALEEAVAEGAFVLHYQPIVALASGETVGFEALVRWNHPTRGMVAPVQFIEFAEETGLIVPIGSWVLEHAVASTAELHRMQPTAKPPYISVNVSARQFRMPGFVDQVRRVLATSGLPPQCLMLEITESLLLRDDEQVWADLAVLRDMGIHVAIDDFGTGFSSLSYLRQIPIDVLKIDKSFIDAISTSSQQLALVDGIIRLAHTLGLRVIAEGIEQADQRACLIDVGCVLGQGYFFSRPMGYGDAVNWLLADQVAA